MMADLLAHQKVSKKADWTVGLKVLLTAEQKELPLVVKMVSMLVDWLGIVMVAE